MIRVCMTLMQDTRTWQGTCIQKKKSGSNAIKLTITSIDQKQMLFGICDEPVAKTTQQHKGDSEVVYLHMWRKLAQRTQRPKEKL